MFTGLIQKTGETVRIESGADGGRLLLKAHGWEQTIVEGESIAVQGVCLTLAGWERDVLRFDVLNETLKRTNLGGLEAGRSVNLERALRVGDALGGHIVTGHVDGMGTLRAVRQAGRDIVLEVECDPELTRGMVRKGSVSLDGASLTIVDLEEDFFSVHVIPHTLKNTAFKDAKRGDRVNIETDMLGKYVQRWLFADQGKAKITWDKLRENGFA